jgi:hypothetical protein
MDAAALRPLERCEKALALPKRYDKTLILDLTGLGDRPRGRHCAPSAMGLFVPASDEA